MKTQQAAPPKVLLVLGFTAFPNWTGAARRAKEIATVSKTVEAGPWNGNTEKNVLAREMPVGMDDHRFVEVQDLFSSRLESKLSFVGLQSHSTVAI